MRFEHDIEHIETHLLSHDDAGSLNDAFLLAKTALEITHASDANVEKQLACTILVLHFVEGLCRPNGRVRGRHLAEVGLQRLLASNEVPVLPLAGFAE